MKKEKKNLLKDYRKDNVDEDYNIFCWWAKFRVF